MPVELHLKHVRVSRTDLSPRLNTDGKCRLDYIAPFENERPPGDWPVCRFEPCRICLDNTLLPSAVYFVANAEGTTLAFPHRPHRAGYVSSLPCCHTLLPANADGITGRRAWSLIE